MFEISPETKEAAVAEMREILGAYGVTDAELEAAFDSAVTIVKRQFGL